jgi:hypothetical protein
MTNRRPRKSAIARCIGTADVVATVRFALQIAIRGGGHNVTTTAASG